MPRRSLWSCTEWLSQFGRRSARWLRTAVATLVCGAAVLGGQDGYAQTDRSSRAAVTAIPVAPAISQAAWLRDRLPADTVFYARLPSFWGLSWAPDGRVLDAARGHQSVADAITKIRAGLAREPLLAEGTAAVFRVLLSHWAGPAEVAMVAPGRIPGPGSTLLVSVPLSEVRDATAFTQLVAAVEGPPLELDAAGYGMAGDAALRFDAASGRVLLLGGVGVTVERLQQLEASLKPAAPPFAAEEGQIDRSGQGAYLWLDLVAVRALSAMGATDPGMAALGQIASHGRALALGFGTTDSGKGRIGLQLAAPKAPFLAYLPREPRRFDLRTTGTPNAVYILSMLFSPDEYTAFKERLAVDFGEKASAGLAELERKFRTWAGFTLADIAAALGPDFGGFNDEAGDYGFVKVRDRARLEAILATLKKHPGVTLRKQRDIQVLDLPGSSDPGNPFPALAIMDRLHSRLFWVDEGEYLVFANTPQALLDRLAAKPRDSLRSFLARAAGAEFEQALLLVTGTNAHVARTTYDYSLLFLHGLADIAGVELDLFAFPSAGQLKLPRDGSVSLLVGNSADGVLLGLQYDASGMDFLAGGSSLVALVAISGVLAAIALPVYQDYIGRSQVSEAVASAAAAKLAIAEYVAVNGKLPASLSEAGLEDDVLATRYAEIRWQEGQLLIQFRDQEPVNARVRGAQVALALRQGDEIEWVCGNAAPGEADQAFHGGHPANQTTLVDKYLPMACRGVP